MALAPDEGTPNIWPAEVLDEIADEIRLDEGDYREIVIRILGNGQVAYRLWPRAGGDYVGGVVMLTPRR